MRSHPLSIIPFFAALWVSTLLVGAVPSRAVGQEAVPLVDQHAWARFGVGSWKLVRVFTETVGEGGKVESVSVTETRTTLESADADGYTLRVEVTVEVAGKRFQAEPKKITYGFNGELAGQKIEIKELGEARLEINGASYAAKKRELSIDAETSKSVSTSYYSTDVSPHTLRRVTVVTDKKTNERTYRADVAVLALDMPERVLTEIKSSAHVRTLEVYSNGTRKLTVEVLCDSVPGGVICHSLKQLNDAGIVVQRSTLDLIDYQAVARPVGSVKVQPPVRRRIFKKRR